MAIKRTQLGFPIGDRSADPARLERLDGTLAEPGASGPCVKSGLSTLGDMVPPETPVRTTRSSLVRRSAGGAAMGALIVSVPFAAGHPFQLSGVELGVATLIVITSALMGGLWGGRFLDALSRALDSTAV